MSRQSEKAVTRSRKISAVGVPERKSMMPSIKQTITPCLWFDTEAEAAAKHYTAIFPNSRIKQISRYGEAGRDVRGKAAGSVMTVAFEIEGQPFVALNGG